MSEPVNPYRVAADALVRESGVMVRRVRSSNTGIAFTKSEDWGIEAPEPRGPISFGVFAHEVGHQMLHRHNSAPRWQEEVEAEQYALAQFDRFGLEGSEKYEFRAVTHLRYAFDKAVRRSAGVAEKIRATFPDWWSRAEASRNTSMLHPALSRERRALDV